MAKKYTIELTEKQARLLSWACDTLPRLIQGQAASYLYLFEAAWERRCLEATGKHLDEEFEGGWSAMRDEAEGLCREIKRRFWGQPGNGCYGVHYDDTADILFDLNQVIRHQLWLDNPDPKKPMFTMSANPAHQFGSEPLATIKSEEI